MPNGLDERRLKPHLREVFDGIAPELDVQEFRPLPQRYWCYRLGILQQSLSRSLQYMVTHGVLICERGRENRYRLNAEHAAVQVFLKSSRAD